MTSALARVSGNASALERRKAAARKAQQASGGLNYLSINGDSDWVLGEDALTQNGQVVVIDPTSFENGWMTFTDAGNQYRCINIDDGDPILESELPSLEGIFFKDEPAKWKSCRIMKGVILTGDQRGEAFRYVPTSKGGITAWGFVTAWSTERLETAAESGQYPLLHLGATYYYHKKWKKMVTNPLMTLVQWDATISLENEIDLEALHAAVEEARAVGLTTYRQTIAAMPKKPKGDPEEFVAQMVDNALLEGYVPPTDVAEVVSAKVVDTTVEEIIEEAELPKPRRRARSVKDV